MELPMSRQVDHQPDSTVAWAHPAFGGRMVHNHAIPESRSPSEKSALGDHIDKYHMPPDALLQDRPREV